MKNPSTPNAAVDAALIQFVIDATTSAALSAKPAEQKA
jgi:hypothetical protein